MEFPLPAFSVSRGNDQLTAEEVTFEGELSKAAKESPASTLADRASG
ncbi:hypothetical protein HFN72_35810 [Rhizobium laguerreae]|nr:hypothetical protein [Rhizobium laguerreae]MBY3531213.1 hypothetical protein [Rhizobium laguerreae]